MFIGPGAVIGELYAPTVHESLEAIAARLHKELLDARRSGQIPESLGFDITPATDGLEAGVLAVNLYSEPVDTEEEGAALDAAICQVLACASQFNAIDLTHPQTARFFVSITAYDHPDGAAHALRVLVGTMLGDTADCVRDFDGSAEPLPAPLSGPDSILAG